MSELIYTKEPSLAQIGAADLLFELRRRINRETRPGLPAVAQLQQSQIICELAARNRNAELNDSQDNAFMDLLLAASKQESFQTDQQPSPAYADLTTDRIIEECIDKLAGNSEELFFSRAFGELKARLKQGKLTNDQSILLVILSSMRELRRPVATGTLPAIPAQPAPEVQKETLAAEVLRSIERWSIHGRVREGTSLRGEQTQHPNASVSHGPNVELFTKFKDSILNRFVVFIDTLDPSLRSLINSQYVSVVASDREGYSLWDYCFFQDGKGIGSKEAIGLRGEQYTPVGVRFELPTNTSKKLWTELGTNPDFIDEIYSKGFPGSEDSAQSQTGFRRVKSNKLFLAQYSNFRDFPLSPWTSQLLSLSKKLIERTFKVPHGIGDPMQENYLDADIENEKIPTTEPRAASQTSSVQPEALQPPVVEKPSQVKEAVIKHPENPRATFYIKDITRSFARGKVRAGTSINGKTITRPNGYHDHGKDVDLVAAVSNNFEGRLKNVIRTYRVDNTQYVNSDVLVVKPSDVRGRIIWQLNYFQDETKAVDADRGISPAYVVWELPEAQSRMLWNEMTTNPDIIGDIFRQAFVGLEDLDPESEAPLGMRRIRTKRLYVADQQVLNQIPDGYIGPKEIDTYMGKFYRLNYKNPQGVGDPLPERSTADYVQTQTKNALSTGANQSPDVQGQPTQEKPKRKENPKAQEFAEKIIRKAVHGKFFAGTTLNGEATNVDGYGLATIGPNVELVSEVKNTTYEGFLQSLSSQDVGAKLPHLLRSHYLAVLPSKNGYTWRLSGFQGNDGADSRETRFDVYWELPAGVTGQLWGAIASDPDIVQDIFFRAFQGLEAADRSPLKTKTGQNIGMRGIPSDTIYIAQNRDIEKIGHLTINSRQEDVSKALHAFTIKQYTDKPYGSSQTTKFLARK